MEKPRLNQLNISLRNKQAELDARCQEAEAQHQIEVIAAGILCKIVSSGICSNGNAASIIADAILQEPHAVELVARSTGNNLEMEKDWELMSELDKDELLDKEIVREL